MGVYLHPLVDSPEALEVLAGVQPGTAARVASYERNCGIDLDTLVGSTPAHGEYQDRLGRFYGVLDTDKQAADYYHFWLFGFGKLKEATWNVLNEHGLDGSGQCTDLELAYHLIECQERDMSRVPRYCRFITTVDGVRWS